MIIYDQKFYTFSITALSITDFKQTNIFKSKLNMFNLNMFLTSHYPTVRVRINEIRNIRLFIT